MNVTITPYPKYQGIMIAASNPRYPYFVVPCEGRRYGPGPLLTVWCDNCMDGSSETSYATTHADSLEEVAEWIAAHEEDRHSTTA